MNRPLFYPDERVDLLDFVAALLYAQAEGTRSARALLVPRTDAVGYVLQGLAVTVHGGGAGVAVALGADARVLLAETRDGVVYPGRMCEDEGGVGSLVLLATNFTPPIPAPASLYDLYIRSALDPGASQQRIFWNVTTGQEQGLPVDTAAAQTYELTAVASGAPNPYPGEAYRIATVAGLAGAVTAVTKTRRFLFEGIESSAPTYKPTWGDGANDRNVDRATHGLHDLATFVQYTRRQIQDILGERAGVLARPWSVVHGSLPTLGTLYLEHHEEGVGAPAEGHHRGSIHHVSGGPTDLAEVVLRAAVGTELLIGQSDIDNRLLRIRDNAAGSPAVCVMTDVPGQPCGLLVTGPSGEVADLGAGQTAHIRFGRTDEAPWTASRDFALVAAGAAADSGRTLTLTVGQGGTLKWPMQWTGFGDSLGSRHVKAACDASGLGDFGYGTAKMLDRYVQAAAFSVVDHRAALAPMAVQGVDVGLAGCAGTIWYATYLDSAAAQTEGGWAIKTPVSGNAAADTLAAARMVASLDWLPNGATINAGDFAGLVCEADAAWQFVAHQRLGLSIWARNAATGVVACIACCQLDLSAAAVLTEIRAALVAGGYGALPHTVNHDGNAYFLVVQAEDTGGAGVVCAGAVNWTTAYVPFRVSRFSH